MKRGDREVEHLFGAVQNTAETKSIAVEKCRNLAESQLPLLKIKLDESFTLCERLLNRSNSSDAVNILVLFKF